ncbi:large ribosomal subunit protein mL42 [Onthophagus taurus]|uniref:large ribosomal subunit protein mL42 n=1 Tax=Onthophagus taurus TaxID=166361 RepID=UPI0039BDA42F
MSLLRQCVLKYTLSVRLGSSSSKFAKTDDGSTFVFWHPKKEFSYENTRPLPEVKAESSGVLKTELSHQLKEVFNKKSPDMAREELMRITYTTKHKWFPRSRDRKAKKTPMDREYL